ncbi:hypothetical protein PP175_28995 (plasmid) [Aneurinibacillus sp. Ricciae_BoGa-3]|uniref:hypothetical protein n=1 Tax=Aneurinibacillus sp. Ricciae_BoGa-3 TaxID=3022697 RepID=UPI0023401553|nr:hypothetical protein [Aneurinibacillus sp. Ricciae_BoGa-3]WCK57229.1 hypothetical protein PP175_28995 [Aneurinibacillus sp. Ricciae_BoGa-3]
MNQVQEQKMNWRNKPVKKRRPITWKMVVPNKWSSKVTDTNYLFVVITPLNDGKYELKYMDAELKDYSKEEKEIVRIMNNIGLYANRELALKVMEHYGHYEWIEKVDSKRALHDELVSRTSFQITLLRNLVEAN